MKIEKLEKYRKGNFVLKHEHLTAQRKLIHIRNLITRRFNLVGGDRKPVVEKLNLINKDEFMNDNTVADIITNITSNMQDEGLLVDADQQVFQELMAADRALVTEFKNYESLDSQNYNGLENPEKVREELLNIQKSLFNLQVKIIFSKLKKITKVDITPLLSVINNKINRMNNYIKIQEEIFTGESVPAAPQNNQSSSNTQVESSETNKNSSNLNQKATEFEPKNQSESVNPPAQSNGTKKSPEEIAKAMTDFIKEENIDIAQQKPLTPEQLTKLKQMFGDLYEKAYEKDPELVNPPQTDDLALLEDVMKEL
jgi:hypothetical protein